MSGWTFLRIGDDLHRRHVLREALETAAPIAPSGGVGRRNICASARASGSIDSTPVSRFVLDAEQANAAGADDGPIFPPPPPTNRGLALLRGPRGLARVTYPSGRPGSFGSCYFLSNERGDVSADMLTDSVTMRATPQAPRHGRARTGPRPYKLFELPARRERLVIEHNVREWRLAISRLRSSPSATATSNSLATAARAAGHRELVSIMVERVRPVLPPYGSVPWASSRTASTPPEIRRAPARTCVRSSDPRLSTTSRE